MMKIFTKLLLASGIILSYSFNLVESTYQVISQHPHDLEQLAPYIKTVKKDGRLWLVRTDKNIPQKLMKYLAPATGKESSFKYRPGFLDSIQIVKDVSSNQFDDILKSFKRVSGMRLDISSRLANIDPRNIENDVIQLANFPTRYAGTEGNKEALNLVKEKFEQIGFSTSLNCYGRNTCNLVADKKGKTKNKSILLVMGHIDSVGEEFAGADDNASGVAVMLEMARALESYDNTHTIRFLVTNSEELGLVGSTAYVRQLEKDRQLKNITLAINMDMVGYNRDGVVELETNPEFEKLSTWMAELAVKFTNLTPKITLGAWGSDHVPFLKRGVPAILTIEHWETKTPCYHKACDLPDTLNYLYAAEIAKLNVAAILTKDSAK